MAKPLPNRLEWSTMGTVVAHFVLFAHAVLRPSGKKVKG